MESGRAGKLETGRREDGKTGRVVVAKHAEGIRSKSPQAVFVRSEAT